MNRSQLFCAFGLATTLCIAAAPALAGSVAAPSPAPYESKPVVLAKDASYVLPDGSIYIVGNDGMEEMLEKFNALFAKTHPGFKFTILLKGSSTGIGGSSEPPGSPA